MIRVPHKILGLNDLLRACAILALWPRSMDPKIEAYSGRDPTLAPVGA